MDTLLKVGFALDDLTTAVIERCLPIATGKFFAQEVIARNLKFLHHLPGIRPHYRAVVAVMVITRAAESNGDNIKTVHYIAP